MFRQIFLCSFYLIVTIACSFTVQAQQPSPPTQASENISFTGKWSSDWGPVELTDNFTGTWQQRRGIGQITGGSYNSQKRQIVFRYYQPWNKMDGTCTLAVSDDGNRLSGTYTQQQSGRKPGSGGTGGWTMMRAAKKASDPTSPQVPPQVTANAQALRRVVLTYTGNKFNLITGRAITTNNHITISLTFDVPSLHIKIDNSNQGLYLKFWSMSDGVHTLTNTSANASFRIFEIVTDLTKGSNNPSVYWHNILADAGFKRFDPQGLSFTSSADSVADSTFYGNIQNGGYSASARGRGKWSATVSTLTSTPEK